MKEKYTFMAKISILIAAFYTMADMFVVTPILGEISMAFPAAKITTIELCYSMSQFTIIISSLLCGYLCTKFSKKSLMIFGGTLVAIFGSFGGTFDNLVYILVMRAIEGFGAGICITLIPAIIAEMFKEEKEMTMLMGLQSAIGAVLGSISSIIAGKIASSISWHYSYYVYLFALIIIILQVCFLPKKAAEKPYLEIRSKAKINKASAMLALVALVYASMTTCIFIKTAQYFLETGIGGANIAGMAQSFITFGSFFGAALMAWAYKNTRSFIDFTCWMLMLTGVIIIICFNNVSIIYAGMIIFGLGYGSYFPWLYAKGAMICAPNSETKTISLITAAYYLGMFLGTFAYAALATLFNNDSAHFAFVCMIVFCIILCTHAFLQGFKNRGQVLGEIKLELNENEQGDNYA